MKNKGFFDIKRK